MNKEELEAYCYAMRLLVKREYCTAQIQQKYLARAVDSDVASVVIEKLKADGYLNDQRFADMYLRSRLDKGEAPWLAAKRAQQQGADESSVQVALDALTSDYDAYAVARDLLLRRDPAGLRFEDARIWQRQARFLQGKGFSMDIVLHVLKEKVEDCSENI